MRYSPAFIGLACVLAGAPAQAEQGSLGFTFAPLACSTQAFPPSAPPVPCGLQSVSGSFTYDDVNGDGRIELAELLRLQAGVIVVPSISPFGVPVVTSFAYSAATGLQFSAYDGWRTRITTGVSYRSDGPGGNTVYAWLPETTTSIYPVPEPASFWLLLAGVAGLGGWRAFSGAAGLRKPA